MQHAVPPTDQRCREGAGVQPHAHAEAHRADARCVPAEATYLGPERVRGAGGPPFMRVPSEEQEEGVTAEAQQLAAVGVGSWR